VRTGPSTVTKSSSTARRTRSRPRTLQPGSAQQSERAWLGQELHDGPAQLLVVALMQVRAASVRTSRGDDASLELENLRALIVTALDDVRSLSRELGGKDAPAALLPALEELAKRCSNRLLSVEVIGAPERLDELSPSAASELLRIAQTAIGNVIRHASASRCKLSLSEANGRICLQIEDDGRGFDPLFCSGGMGLSGMRERAASMGGGCSLETSPGHGTSVRIEVPLRAKPAARGPRSPLADVTRQGG